MTLSISTYILFLYSTLQNYYTFGNVALNIPFFKKLNNKYIYEYKYQCFLYIKQILTHTSSLFIFRSSRRRRGQSSDTP